MRPKLDALFDLIAEILDVTKKIVEFYELPRSDYFTAESPEIVAAASHIPTAVFWTIRSIVVASTQILALTSIGIEYVITFVKLKTELFYTCSHYFKSFDNQFDLFLRYLTEPWELSSLAHKLSNIKGHLVELIERCYRFIRES